MENLPACLDREMLASALARLLPITSIHAPAAERLSRPDHVPRLSIILVGFLTVFAHIIIDHVRFIRC